MLFSAVFTRGNISMTMERNLDISHDFTPLLLFGCTVMSNSLWPHGVQHARASSNSCPSHQVSDAIQPSNPLSSPFPAFNLPQHQCLFQWIGSLHQVAKVLKLQFQHQSSSEYSELISSKIDWFDLALHGTLKSLLQHGSKASILWHSAFFMVQLSHPYMTTGKTIALTIWNCTDKVMPLTKQCLCFLMPYTQIILWFLKVVNVALI